MSRAQAHEFFARVLERDPFGGAARELGRFRSYHADQAAAARASGMSDGALKVAVHRVRRRFRVCCPLCRDVRFH